MKFLIFWLMKSLWVVLLFCSFFSKSNQMTRLLEYNGSKVKTTFDIDEKFIGKYIGKKSGFLELKIGGIGVYQYDYPGITEGCSGEHIEFTWGFIVDENDEIVKFERPYGFSYPIIYNCTGDNAFQGCTKRSMVDYILEYKDGSITISSSDDWEKVNN